MVKAQRILRTISSKDAKLWLDWSRGLQGTIIDAVKDPHDPLPAFVGVAQYLLYVLRHPRAFVRQYGLEPVGANATAKLQSRSPVSVPGHVRLPHRYRT
jgi:hypothetical protein